MAVIGGYAGNGGSNSPVPFKRPVDLTQLLTAFLLNQRAPVEHAIHGRITNPQMQTLIHNMIMEQASAFPGFLAGGKKMVL